MKVLPRRIGKLLSALAVCCLFCLAPAQADAQSAAPPPASASEPQQDNAAAPALPAVSPQKAGAPQAAATEPVTAQAAPLPDISLSWSGYFQALAILCLALAGLWGLLWIVKRRGGIGAMGFSGSQGMRIESRLALGPKKWILVARYMNRRLVIGVTEQQITLLTELYEEDNTAQPDSGQEATGPSFAALLKKDKPEDAPPLTLHEK